jgi:hypothetical protein
MLSEPIQVVATIARTFDTLGIRYLVGGSVASSVYGIPRATQDVDLVADLQLSQVDAVTKSMAGEFYVDADMIRDAIQRRASFNVVHLETMFKADIFILQGDSWSREEMARARTEELDIAGSKVNIRFASPEDTLLHKLIWYKLGNQISDRQWSDILGVIKVQGNMLDQAYLDRWAPLLDVFDLLLRARREQRGPT